MPDDETLPAHDLKEKSDRRARAVSLVALVTGVLLAIVAFGLGYSAVNTTVELRKGKAALFAREADALSDQGQYAKAMLMALAGVNVGANLYRLSE